MILNRDRLERLVRNMARPAIADERISMQSNGDIKLKLKTPWRDGTESLVAKALLCVQGLKPATDPARRVFLTTNSSRSILRTYTPNPDMVGVAVVPKNDAIGVPESPHEGSAAHPQ